MGCFARETANPGCLSLFPLVLFPVEELRVHMTSWEHGPKSFRIRRTSHYQEDYNKSEHGRHKEELTASRKCTQSTCIHEKRERKYPGIWTCRQSGSIQSDAGYILGKIPSRKQIMPWYYKTGSKQMRQGEVARCHLQCCSFFPTFLKKST